MASLRHREGSRRMGNTSRSSDLSASRRAELETRFREIDALIVRQKQALQEVRKSGAIFVAAAHVLRLLEQEQSAVIEELGYNPRAN